MSGEWQRLSYKVRNNNLYQMRPLGTWESQELQRTEGRLPSPGQQPAAKTKQPTSPPPAPTLTPKRKPAMTQTPTTPAPAATAAKNIPEAARKTDRIAVSCALCGKESRAAMVAGLRCCGTCEAIRRNANLRPQLMLAQLREFHPELLPAPGQQSAPKVSPASCELAEAHTELDKQHRRISDQAIEIGELQEKCNKLTATLEGLRAAGDEQDRQPLNSELAAANVRLVQQVRELTEKNYLLEAITSRLAMEKVDLQTEIESLQNEKRELVATLAIRHDQLAAGADKTASLEQEIDRLREGIAARIRADAAAVPEQIGHWETMPCPPGYETLTAVLVAALEQASCGKGKERHSAAGEPFDRQKICEITRRVGIGYPLGQAIKKAEESIRLGDRGPAEILGAINYLAAAHICMSETVQQA